ncbi:MAG: phosphate signaling complex protein PhoU [Candidatus Hydrogenedentes bacterium]|nr:phosphate signaling complex protein PhoU [Candidatus Hydrogenedentota bacterium]
MSRHLQNEIDKLKKRILDLGTLVEEAVYRAIHAFADRDTAVARSVIDADTVIDQMEVDIEEDCQKILALHQPVAHDLRFIIAVLKINTELERIGDATVNISERTLFLSTVPRVDIPYDFPGMAQKAQTMLHKSLDALVNLDVAAANAVIAADDEVDAINRDMYVSTERCIREQPEAAYSYIHLLGVSRYIERIADHASNIAEDVIYLVEGRIIRHHANELQSIPPAGA